ncbi:MAG TPA: phosphatidate cytidylyltransferase [Candidatus Acidoferrales bacterium]|nr:phosphatidate cytidylyltransferase [Candidatus Acidoferrales bacterium]
MLVRVATGTVLIAIVVALVWWGPAALLAAVAAAAAIVALHEFLALGERVGLRAFRLWSMVCAAGLFYAQYSSGMMETHDFGAFLMIRQNAVGLAVSVVSVFLIFLFGCVAIGLATRRPLQDVLPAISISAAGQLFIALPFSYLVRVNEIGRASRELVLFTLCLIWAGDTLAYFVGRSIGRLPMAPALSPKKTWEGAFANMVGSLLVAILFARWMQTDTLSLLLIAGLANAAGQMGDLIESAYKRGAGVKDSSSLLPGHGGMLDRIDSLILASPVVWVAWQWLAAR